MNRGFILFVQKNNTSDYLKQAVACSLSIKKFMPDDQICLMTDIDVPENYKKHFDHIQDIPGLDLAVDSEWKVNNRCKIYRNSPFEQSIVLDVDMLLLENIEHWWDQLSKYELYYTDKVKTYRNEWVSDDYYRKVFVENSLPNVYCGFHYFKKCKNNKVFFDLLTDIVVNYEQYSKRFTKNRTQSWCSMDVATAIAIKLLGIQHKVFSKHSNLTFTHMKPRIQNYKSELNLWTEQIDYNLNSQSELFVGNIKQKGLFHYVEDNFLTDNMLEQLKCI
jgi:hypothetical protein|tara:strand:- start:7098 stop:7925 length:828 start_codon:yes stop_codon:yes gene_type:complete